MKRILPTALSLLLAAPLAFADPGTAFNYQGFLKNGSAPLTGTVSLRFTLYDSSTDGAQVGAPLTRLDQVVTSGSVSQSLDFGDIFDGTPRYLQVEVDLDGDSDDFTPLTPRVQLLPIPYAIHATDTDTLDGFDSTAFDLSTTNETNTGLSLTDSTLSLTDAGGTLTVDLSSFGDRYSLDSPDGTRQNLVATNNGGNVGVNTSNPAYPFDVHANTRVTGNVVVQTGSHLGLEVYPGEDIGTSVYERLFVFDEDTFETAFSVISDNGRVGIGVLYPDAKLEVAGTPGTDGIMYPDGTLQTTAYTGPDGDSDPTNETNTSFVFDGTNLKITDAGGTVTASLQPLFAQVLTSILTSPDGAPATAASIDADGDFTVSNDSLHVDVINDRVGIATTSPAQTLDVNGTAAVSGNMTVDATTLAVDATNNRVGIGTTSPVVPFDVSATQNEVAQLLSTSNVGTWLRLKNTSTGGDNWRMISTGSANGEGAGNLLVSNEAGGVRLTVKGSNGATGVGTTTPNTRLWVQDSQSGNDTSVSSYVATIHNSNTGTEADGLRISTATSSSNTGNNYVQFSYGATGSTFGTAAGAIQGNGAGGVSYNTTGSDFAEELPRLDARESIQPGDVVGVFGGKVSRRTVGADWVMAVSSNPAFVGSANGDDEVTIAFLGQIPVRVAGVVGIGDYIIASGLNDGTAIAITPSLLDSAHASQVIGRAWESSSDLKTKLINTAIGIAAASQISTQSTREIEALRAENQELRGRLDKLEALFARAVTSQANDTSAR